MSSFKINHNNPSFIKEDVNESIITFSKDALFNSNSLQSVPVDNDTTTLSNGDILVYDSAEKNGHMVLIVVAVAGYQV